MSKKTRIDLITELERERNTALITYITSTRESFEVHMALDSIEFIYNNLIEIKKNNKGKINIDFFIVSNGGDGIVPWRLITLIREFTDKITVLVPYRAFSAATLAALGANEIIMHPMGMLGPTDPTVANIFNPIDPTNPTQRLGISVEDVNAYIALIKEDFGIQHQDELVQSLNSLTSQVHPLALGNVKRSISQSRLMANKLLRLHMGPEDKHKINEIVDNLTSKSYFHGHPINRKEAIEDIGLKTVKYAKPKEAELMWNLYLEYEKELKLNKPYMAAQYFTNIYPNLNPDDTKETKPFTEKLCFIESQYLSYLNEGTYKLIGTKLKDHSTTVKQITIKRGWNKV